MKGIASVKREGAKNSSAMSTVGLGFALAYSINWVANIANATTGVL